MHLLSIIWAAVIFVAGAISTKLIDPFTDDIYHWVKSRLGKHTLDISVSQTENSLSIPGGYQQSIPYNTHIFFTFNVVNHGSYDITIEALDGTLKAKEGELPQHLSVYSTSLPVDHVVGARKTVPAKAEVVSNLPVQFAQNLQTAWKDYLEYVVNMPDEIILTINLKYTYGGKAYNLLKDLNPSIKRTIAKNWHNFLTTNSPTNQDLQEEFDHTVSELRKLF